MTIFLRQSTASQEVPLGYFVDSTDGNTEETGLTIANTDIKIWKTGATTLANKNSGGGTHISNGIYYAVLDATDTDTIGPLRMFVHVSGALAVKVDCVVLDEAVYDVLFGTTALATATNITAGTITTATNVTTVNGLAAGVITATSIAADAITAAKIATGAIDADAIADGAIDAGAIADGAIDAATFAAGAINAAAIASDAITDAKVASDVTIASVTGAVGSVTGNVGGNVTGTIGGFTTAAKAEIQTEAEDALVTHRVDELLNADSDIDGAAPPTVGSVFHELMSKTAGSFTFDQTTDSNEAIRDNMGTAQTGDSFARLGAPAGASVSADIAAIEAQTDDIGTAGAGLTAVPWNASWDAEVQSEVQDALDATVADSVPADGTRPSISQAVLMLTRFLNERSVSGTTLTVKKEDGSTTSMTFTLNDATSPTSITRAS